jgi:uncharacterized protein YlxW (UPF0749 family)
MNPFEMVVLIVAIVMIASVLRARHGDRRRGRHGSDEAPVAAAENSRLKEEVQALRDRIAVLERITVEKESSLEREIEKLRDR